MKHVLSFSLLTLFVLLVTCSQAQEVNTKSKRRNTKVKTEASTNQADNSNTTSLMNTSWATFLGDPVNDTLIIHYTTDSSYVTSKTNGQTLVTSTYQINQDTLTFHDLGGVHACPDNMIAKYRVVISGDALKFDLISDDCDGRGGALKDLTWQRLKENNPQKQP